MTTKIAYLTWGESAQIRSFRDFASFMDDMLYVDDLDQYDLGEYAAVVVPDSMSEGRLAPHAARLNAYVRQGGFLIVFDGKIAANWIDVVPLQWKPINTRDWLWWTKPGGRLEIYRPEPLHPICHVIPERDMGWHWFGAFELCGDAVSALNLADDSGSLFLDYRNLAGGGRLIVSTLDPHLHNGERFMPATTRFLTGFYTWLNAEVGRKRPARRAKVTYVQGYDHPSEWLPKELEASFAGTDCDLLFCPLEKLSDEILRESDVLYLPDRQDQFRLRGMQNRFLEFLGDGGHMVICSEPAIAWLPFLKPFRAVPARPFTNIRVRVRDDPFGLYGNMDEAFDGWKGIFGQYARGWSPMPDGGIWLTEIGPESDPRPADWLWRYPTDDGKGGYVFMHNGDNLTRYPDHGPAKEGLARDVCLGVLRAASTHYPWRE